jgi:hypothetical protein
MIPQTPDAPPIALPLWTQIRHYPVPRYQHYAPIPIHPSSKLLIMASCSLTDPSPIELPSLNINAVLPNGHPQILHRQHSPPLSTTLSTSSISWPLNPQRPSSSSLTLPALCRAHWCRSSPSSSPNQIPHWVIGRRAVRRADPRVLVCIGSDVGDELLGREGEEAREARVCCGGWGESGARQVVVGYCIWDLPMGVRTCVVAYHGVLWRGEW